MHKQCIVRGVAKTKRVRAVRSVTLNPDGVRKLLEVGAARPVAETNLSRVIDDAIAGYVAAHWQAAPIAGDGGSAARRGASNARALGLGPGSKLSAEGVQRMRASNKRKAK